MEKLTLRKPQSSDLVEACRDLVTLRTAPPLIVSMALIVILTGNLVFGALSVGLTSLAHAFWSRLVSTQQQ
jgi:hypothetical protein